MGRRILSTERLHLEEINSGHFESLYTLLSNEKVQRYFPKVLDKEESMDFLKKIERQYKDDGFGFWAVIRKSNSEFIGICGLLSQMIDGKKEVEVGYRFLDSYWGNGYATEAARGCMDYGQCKLKLTSIISLIRKVNIPSIKVAERNGLRYEREVDFYDYVHGIYRKIF